MTEEVVSAHSAKTDGPAPGDRVRARVERLVFQGDGFGRLPDGRVFFAAGTAPGDEVELEVREAHPGFVRADARALLAASPDRTDPPCPYFGTCGGCQWQHLSRPAQLEWKRQVLQELLGRVGKLEAEVLPPLAPLDPWGYRARAQLKVVGHGRPLIGFHRRESNRVVDVERCPLLAPRLDAVLGALRRMRTPALPALLPGLREIWLAAGTGTDEVLVACFARPRERAALRLLFHTLQAVVPGVQGVLALAGAPRESPQVVDWHGKRTLTERVGAFRFRVDPTAFFQVSGVAAAALTALVEAAADLTGRERVLDLHCGVGTFTVPLAHRAAEMVGVEAHAAAVQDAEHNLELNRCPHARIVHAQAEQALPVLARTGGWDVVVLDPPRAGCSRQLLDRLCARPPRRLVYVSCDPSTLARDLGVLTRGGFRCLRLQPVDLFPQTFHVETVAVLEPASPA